MNKRKIKIISIIILAAIGWIGLSYMLKGSSYSGITRVLMILGFVLKVILEIEKTDKE